MEKMNKLSRDKKNLFLRILQNVSNPQGFWGCFMIYLMNRKHAPLTRWGMSFLPLGTDCSVLDIGCGGGATLAYVLKRCPKGKAYGIDISSDSVAFAKRTNAKEMGFRCFVELGSADTIPYANATFDAVTAIETVYFWKDLSMSFAEVLRVLKTDGKFMICCEIVNPGNNIWDKRIDGMVIRTTEEIKSLLLQAGFKNVDIHRHPKSPCCIVANK